MFRLVWCIIGLLAIIVNIDGNRTPVNCPHANIRKVQEVLWPRCDEEIQRRMKEVKQNTGNREQELTEKCCVLSDTMTCWVDSLRSECGDEAANTFIKQSKFKDECSSWKYPDSISLCHPWYTKWWFITIVAILAIVIVASLVIWGLRKRGRQDR